MLLEGGWVVCAGARRIAAGRAAAFTSKVFQGRPNGAEKEASFRGSKAFAAAAFGARRMTRVSAAMAADPGEVKRKAAATAAAVTFLIALFRIRIFIKPTLHRIGYK